MKTIIIILFSLFNHHKEVISLDNGKTKMTISVSNIEVKSDIIEPKNLIHYLDEIFTNQDVSHYKIKFINCGQTLIVDDVPYSRVPTYQTQD